MKKDLYLLKNRALHLRTCVGCREKKPQADLIRVVCDSKHGNVISSSSKQRSNITTDRQRQIPYVKDVHGRSAYLCHSQSCFEQAMKCRGFERSLKQKLQPDFYTRLQEEVSL